MGWRPEEDDGEEIEGREGQASGNRGPADDGRKCTGSAANYDVLGRGPLEVHGVYEDIEEGGGQSQDGAQQIDEGGE